MGIHQIIQYLVSNPIHLQNMTIQYNEVCTREEDYKMFRKNEKLETKNKY